MFQPFLDVTEPFPDAIILISGKGAVEAGNSAAHRFFALQKLAGLKFADLVADPPEKIARYLKTWSGSRQMVTAAFALRLIADTSIRCDGALIKAATAEAPSLLIVRCALASEVSVNDLAVRLEALQTLLAEQANREQERVAYWETSAAVFMHEFGNPLNAISTSLQLVKPELAETVKNPAVRERLFELSHEVQRLSSLLKGFRSFVRPRSATLKPTDLAGSVRDLLAPEQPGFQAAGIHVQFEFDSDLPVVMLDLEMVKQALLNVCKNSVEAMPAGGRLTLKGYLDNEAVVLEVVDTGVGIPDGMDVFQLFTTTKPDAAGLGLPIARQVIFAHKGSIDLISNRERGTTCRIRLPVQLPS